MRWLETHGDDFAKQLRLTLMALGLGSGQLHLQHVVLTESSLLWLRSQTKSEVITPSGIAHDPRLPGTARVIDCPKKS